MSESATGETNAPLPNIAYVDEREDERDNFFNDAYDSGRFGEIHLIAPLQNIEEMLSHILSLNVEALITDFNLTDAAPLEYSGEQLVERFLEIRADFPCFIRTSFEEDAVAESADVNRVYSKDMSGDAHQGPSLFERIVHQIGKHQELVESWRQEMARLSAIPSEERLAKDVERIVELDHKLEASLGADAQVPLEAKFAAPQRSKLLTETEKLIADIKRELGE